MNILNTLLSRLRNDLKAVKQDAFLTDRYLYSKIMKFAPALLKREDSKSLLMQISGIWQILSNVELVNVNKVDTKYFNFDTECTIKKSKDRLPDLFYGYFGPLIKSIYSISGPATDADDEAPFKLIDSIKYGNIVKLKSFKYNKTKYCWFEDGYLWFPNCEWDAVKVYGLFSGDISKFGEEDCKECIQRQEQVCSIPEYLYPELEGFIINELKQGLNIPQDTVDNKQNILRT